MDSGTVTQVKKIIKKWPAYRKFVEMTLPDPMKIGSLSELPIIDKSFISAAINTVPLCKVRNIIPSSGSTGSEFSFGLFGSDEMRRSSVSIETFLNDRFQTCSRKTLLLNLLPGALPFYSACITTASIGVRIDTAISAIKSLGSSFEQIILAGEPLFVKNLMERGLRQSIVWKFLPLFIIVGGEWISESYRDYVEELAGRQRLFSSMGMAELGLNYFFETEETMALRKMICKDHRISEALFGNSTFSPVLFSFDERSITVETVKDTDGPFESILITAVDSDRVLPLIRYKSGDKGTILSWDMINRALRSLGYRALGDTGLPVLAHFGRGKHVAGIYPERIKEVLYSADGTASSTTGNFFIRRSGGVTGLDIQLNEGITLGPVIKNIFQHAFRELPVRVKLHPFERFPYSLDFERKVQYVFEGEDCSNRRGEKIELQDEI